MGLNQVAIILAKECATIEDMELSLKNVVILNRDDEDVVKMPTIAIKGQSRVEMNRVWMKSPWTTCVGVYSAESSLFLNNCALADSQAAFCAVQGAKVQ